MDPAAIGARLASSAVAPLIKKLFVAEGAGGGLVDRPVRVSGLVSFRGEKRALTERDLLRLASELVERGQRSAGPHERAADGDREAVVHTLARTLHGLGDLAMDDVQAVRLGPAALARTLRRANARGVADLSSDATALHDALLDTACLHILHFFTQRSAFVARTLVEQSQELRTVLSRVDELIARTPRRGGEDAAFEARYRAHLAQKHGRLTIYGIDLSDSPDRWPLDAAYLSLEAAATTGGAATMAGTGADGPQAAPSGLHDVLAPVSRLPADQAFSGHDRVFLRGVAGSGKTTLVQWLAVSAARQDDAATPSRLRDRIPFVLPLRSLIRDGAGLPAPDRLLSAVNCPVAGAQPAGWADRVLTEGRGLLLVDGLDEIPERHRTRTRDWLRDLLTAFPGNLWLLTSRPSAVREGWLADEDFTELTLAPMSRGDVSAFIRRWHAAARLDTDDTGRLDGYEQALLTAVETKQDLARLATNPLMCGLLCALHRDRRGHLPRGRKELYDAALSMLLSRRDRERDMHGPDSVELSEEPQIQLLQRLAYWLIRNGRTELERDHARRVIADALPAVPAAAAQGDADRIFGHLLVRSGLLREPATGTVDFVHRTFQDYLGARAAVEAWDIGLLINNATDAQWEDVIRMSVAHARPRERADLLTQLLARGDRATDAAERSRVHLLAMACLEHATELDPAVRTEVEQRAARIIPPRSVEEARALAEAGPVVLELLPGPDALPEDEAVHVVSAASQLGTDAAIPLLKRFRHHPSLGVRSQLAWTWQRFDTERYAEEVLRHLDPDGLDFVATSREELRILRSLDRCSRLMVRGDFEARELLDVVDPSRLTHLRIESNAVITDLAPLRECTELSTVMLRSCPGITDLSPLAGSPVYSLLLNDVPASETLAGLSELSALLSLHLYDPLPREGLAALPADAPLDSLYLGEPVDDAVLGISAWPGLRSLRLNMTRRFGPAHWEELSRLPALTTLGFGCTDSAAPLRFPEGFTLPGLRALYLPNIRVPEDVLDDLLATLPTVFPGLRTLGLGSPLNPMPTVDLSGLAELEHLRRLALDHVRPADGPPGLPGVRLTVTPRPRD
ncbi:NACHT domain-containing protein [Streptomyces sp. NPDC001922]|uniref:NACHT domain-containing protein n=1 Tax=Streptomyces sp. NPDC001922 TaxID=3364624 RepID=UPI0036A07262